MYFGAPAFEDIVTDETSVVKIYLLQNFIPTDRDLPFSIDLAWQPPFLQMPPSFGQGVTQAFHQFVHRDLVYSYNVGTDAQRGFRRVLLKEHMDNHTYTVAYAEESVAPHSFPSTKEITREIRLSRTLYKLMHRLWFVHDVVDGEAHMFFFKYLHDPKVDVGKITIELRHALRSLHTQQARSGATC